MSPLVFLGLAVLIFVVFTLISVVRHRERKASFESSIERFQHEMGVLSPDERDRPDRRR